jgi:GNAT superfamily N-acetyltransferase
MQEQGAGLYLIAIDGETYRGEAVLRFWSKYSEVRARFGDFPEINGLSAIPQRTGVGTLLIEAAEKVSRERGATRVGMAVSVQNKDAHRLYLRLGYLDWGDGEVVDEWTEPLTEMWRRGSTAIGATTWSRSRAVVR